MTVYMYHITLYVRELTPFASALGFAVDEYAANRGTIPPR